MKLILPMLEGKNGYPVCIYPLIIQMVKNKPIKMKVFKICLFSEESKEYFLLRIIVRIPNPIAKKILLSFRVIVKAERIATKAIILLRSFILGSKYIISKKYLKATI